METSKQFANRLEFNSKGERYRDYGTLLLAYMSIIHDREGKNSEYYKHAVKNKDIEMVREFNILINQ